MELTAADKRLVDLCIRVGMPIAREIIAAEQRASAAARYHAIVPRDLPEYDDGGEFGPISASIGVAADIAAASDAVCGGAHSRDNVGDVDTPARVDPLRAYASARIGRAGEMDVMAILRGTFADVRDCSRVGHRGDMSIRCAAGRVCVEVKNYVSAVPHAQVAKFQSDLRTSGSDAGLFISLASQISGVRDEFTIAHEYVSGRYIPCVYMSQPTAACIRVGAQVLVGLIGAYAHVSAIARIDEHLRAQHARELEMAVATLDQCRSRAIAISADCARGCAEVAADVAAVEGRVRALIDTPAHDADICASLWSQIRTHPRVVAYDPRVRTAMRTWIRAVDAAVPAPMTSSWQSRTRGESIYVHVHSGRQLRLCARAPVLAAPRMLCVIPRVLELLDAFPEDITIGAVVAIALTVVNCGEVADALV